MVTPQGPSAGSAHAPVPSPGPSAGPTPAPSPGPSRPSLIGLAVLVLAITAASQWWAGRAARQLGAQVAALAQPGDIRMLSSESCAICHVARQWFVANQVAFSECLVERDAACRAEFEATRSPGTPVLLVRGQPQVGFSGQRLLQGLVAVTTVASNFQVPDRY